MTVVPLGVPEVSGLAILGSGLRGGGGLLLPSGGRDVLDERMRNIRSRTQQDDNETTKHGLRVAVFIVA